MGTISNDATRIVISFAKDKNYDNSDKNNFSKATFDNTHGVIQVRKNKTLANRKTNCNYYVRKREVISC